MPNIVDIAGASSGSTAIALRRDGAVIALTNVGSSIGCSFHGISFNPDTAFSNCVAPVAMPSISRVKSIAAGDGNGYAVRDDGTVWVWGTSTSVNGGAVRTADEYRPLQIPGISDAAQVVASYNGVVYVRTNAGQVYAFGKNDLGQLGRGSVTASEPAAMLIAGLSNIVELGDTQGYSLLARDSNGFVWTVGVAYNVGNGTLVTTQSTPVKVSCPNGYVGDLNLTNFNTACIPAASNTLTLADLSPALGKQMRVNGSTVTLPYSQSFPANTVVTLEMLPDVGVAFSGWRGDMNDFQSRIRAVTMNRDWNFSVLAANCATWPQNKTGGGTPMDPISVGANGGLQTVTVRNGGYATFGNCHWGFTSNDAWLSANADGFNEASFALNVLPNPTTSQRVGNFTIGGTSGYTIQVTQAAAAVDTIPDAFGFSSALGVSLSSLVQSQSVVVSGINADTPVTVGGGEYSIGCTGTFTNAAGVVQNGQLVCVRHMSAATTNVSVVTTLTIGGVTGTFTSATAVANGVGYSLSLAFAGNGGGSVTSSPAGISCSSACVGVFNAGDVVTLTATPASGSVFSGWSVGTGSASCSGTGTCVVTIGAASAITATFTQAQTFAVTPSAGTNGSISPNTAQSISQGATTTFTVTPNAGYTASVGGTCGGNLVGTTYTTNAITAACTVVASFTINAYTVTPSAGANGSISPATAQSVNHGATTTFTVTPNAGYTATVGGTCGGTLVGTTFTTNAVTGACTVAASFTATTSGGVFTENFDGSALQSAYWTPIGTNTISGGLASLSCNAGLKTEGKVIVSGNPIVVESRFAGTGSARDTVILLVDTTNPANYIQLGDTNYSGLGLYMYGGGIFSAVPYTGSGVSVAAYKEYRITISGSTITLQRGDTLASLTETRTAPLPASAVGKSYYMTLSTGGAPYCPGTFDWVKASPAAYPVSVSTTSANGTVSPAGTQNVAAGGTAAIAITANAGFTATVATGAGQCAGTLTGSAPNYSFTTTAVSGPCAVTVSFTAATAGGVCTLQPSPGKDTHYGTMFRTNGMPNDDFMSVGGWGDQYLSLIEFDVASLPQASRVTSAEIWLYYYAGANDPVATINRITAPWTAAGVTLANNPSSTFFANAPARPAAAGWYKIDVTQLYRDWKNGVYPNYGIKISPTQFSNNNAMNFYTSEVTDASLRPRIVVNTNDAGCVAAAKPFDFDGDGKSDLLYWNDTSGQTYIAGRNGAAAGPVSGFGPSPATVWKIAGVGDLNGDLNGDGKADLVYRNDSTGEVFAYLMNGTTTLSSGSVLTQGNLSWKIVGVADFNGDGKADILYRNDTTGETYIYYMNSVTSTGGGFAVTVTDLNWKIVGAADFNGDGTTATRRPRSKANGWRHPRSPCAGSFSTSIATGCGASSTASGPSPVSGCAARSPTSSRAA